jgi:hypothetical protein
MYICIAFITTVCNGGGRGGSTRVASLHKAVGFTDACTWTIMFWWYSTPPTTPLYPPSGGRGARVQVHGRGTATVVGANESEGNEQWKTRVVLKRTGVVATMA